jgi:hypothetical protein
MNKHEPITYTYLLITNHILLLPQNCKRNYVSTFYPLTLVPVAQ